MAHEPIGREGRRDSAGAIIGRTRARLEVAEQWAARRLTGRCTLFCGDVQCPAACPERTTERVAEVTP